MVPLYTCATATESKNGDEIDEECIDGNDSENKFVADSNENG